MKPLGHISKLLLATRPWSFPASVMPLLLGTLCATGTTRPIQVGAFFAALTSLLCLHAAANILSDLFDFRNGLDTQITPTSGALARGLLSTGQMKCWGLLLATTGGGIGLALALYVSPLILWIGLAGVLIGGSYPWLKYHALGDPAVFISFASLGALGGWTVQTAHFSWLPIRWSIPLGLLITAILHANNWRDIETDRACKIRTLAMTLGHKKSAHYYTLLLLLALATAVTLKQPRSALLTLLSLPKIIPLWKTAHQYHRSGDKKLLGELDGHTAQLNLLFGLLYLLGIGWGLHWNP